MRISIYSAVVLAGIGLGCSAPAVAAETSNVRQQLFETDKATALSDFDAKQKRACLAAFNLRYPSHYILDEELAFDESLSQGMYDRLFWKGKGSFQRGLIFAGSVKDLSGHVAGKLLCYYATTDSRLDFQSAYVLPLRKGEAAVASNDHSYFQGNLHASLRKE